jgi:hypothetical protein
MPRLTAVEFRDLLHDALPSETLEFGATPPTYQFFVPKSHTIALGLQIPLVIGDRGMGKSYWWAALQSREHRALLARTAPDTRIGADTIVRAGFGPKLLSDNYPSKDVLTDLQSIGTPSRLIWKTIALWNILHAVNRTETIEGLASNASWRDKVAWLVAHPEQVDRLLMRSDEQLVQSQRDLLLVFDALDTASNDLASFFVLIEGLCQLALEFRSLRRIRAKVFLRPDQFENPRVGRFPDAAKLRASTGKLRWLDTELYGLLWSLLGNHPAHGARYRDDLYTTLGSLVRGRNLADEASSMWVPPTPALFDPKAQESLFHRITGPYMGDTARRGFPYRWLPNHLADARGVCNPRSFEIALKIAAEHSRTNHVDHGYALNYRSLHVGVKEASNVQIEYIKEYPWVLTLMKPLEGMNVPMDFADVKSLWHPVLEDEILSQAEIGSADAARKRLAELGVWREMKTGRIDVPDIYRLGFKLARRGGVPLKHGGEVR